MDNCDHLCIKVKVKSLKTILINEIKTINVKFIVIKTGQKKGHRFQLMSPLTHAMNEKSSKLQRKFD